MSFTNRCFKIRRISCASLRMHYKIPVAHDYCSLEKGVIKIKEKKNICSVVTTSIIFIEAIFVMAYK